MNINFGETNQFHSSARQKKKKHIVSKAIEEKKDNSYLWKHVKKLGNQSSQNSIPDELIIDGDTIHQTNDIMNRLNSYLLILAIH